MIAAPAGAQINFYSYQKTITSATDTGGNVSYDTQYVLFQLGTSPLEESEISVVPHGAYLDVVEDAWISGNLTDLSEPNLISSFLFQGLITLPSRTTVTGLETWKGDTMYRAKLHQTQYSYSGSAADSASLESILNTHIASLRQVDETTYEMIFSRISIGERKHVRVRYLLPNEGNGNTPFMVPVLFNPSYTAPPKFVNLTVLANTTDNAFYLSTLTSPIQLHDSSSYMIPYQPTIALTRFQPTPSTLHITTFPAGAWAGNYMILNTALTDTIIQNLSTPIQTVFVWRWNAPQQIVTFNGQIKGLSQYAYAVIAQAQAMAQAVTALQKLGFQCGLVHSIEGVSGLAYKSTKIDDSSSTKILAYLATFTQQALYSAYVNQGSPTPNWVPVTGGTTAITQGQQDFLSQLKTATGLFGDTSIGFHHVVLMSTGDASTAYFTNLKVNADSILTHATIDFTGAQWRGVDLVSSLPSVTDQSLVQWNGSYFPAFFPLTVQLRIQNADMPYSFPIASLSASDFTITGRTAGAWDTVFTWIGFDQKGKVTATLATKPYLFREPTDSGVAKIWAHDVNHVAEVEETYPGGTFGIVTKSTFLQATIADTSSLNSNTVPFLADFEILAPRSTQVKTAKHSAASGMTIVYRDGILSLTNAGDLRRLELFDLSGRLLARIDLAAFKIGAGSYRIALRSFAKLSGHRVFIVKISGPSFQRIFKLTPGGIL